MVEFEDLLPEESICSEFTKTLPMIQEVKSIRASFYKIDEDKIYITTAISTMISCTIVNYVH